MNGTPQRPLARTNIGLVVAAIAFAIGVSKVAAQEVITVCGASAGYGYYLDRSRRGG